VPSCSRDVELAKDRVRYCSLSIEEVVCSVIEVDIDSGDRLNCLLWTIGY